MDKVYRIIDGKLFLNGKEERPEIGNVDQINFLRKQELLKEDKITLSWGDDDEEIDKDNFY